jgi:hypothetical protein
VLPGSIVVFMLVLDHHTGVEVARGGVRVAAGGWGTRVKLVSSLTRSGSSVGPKRLGGECHEAADGGGWRPSPWHADRL